MSTWCSLKLTDCQGKLKYLSYLSSGRHDSVTQVVYKRSRPRVPDSIPSGGNYLLSLFGLSNVNFYSIVQISSICSIRASFNLGKTQRPDKLSRPNTLQFALEASGWLIALDSRSLNPRCCGLNLVRKAFDREYKLSEAFHANLDCWTFSKSCTQQATRLNCKCQTVEFFLNVFTEFREFSDKNMSFSKRIRTPATQPPLV